MVILGNWNAQGGNALFQNSIFLDRRSFLKVKKIIPAPPDAVQYGASNVALLLSTLSGR